MDSSLVVLGHHHKALDLVLTTHRNHHSPAFTELCYERRGDVTSGACDDDSIERSLFRPAEIAVANSHPDIFVVEVLQPLPGTLSQGVDYLYGEYHWCQLRQHSGLVATSSTDFEDLCTRLDLECLGHECDDIRL